MGGTNIIPAPGVKRLSALEIDTDKDWNEKRIHNVKELEVGYILEYNNDGIPIFKDRTYQEWVNAYNKGEAEYEDYLDAHKYLVEDLEAKKK